MTITDISAFNASLNTHAEVDEPEPEPQPEPQPQPQPQPQPEQVQAAPTAAAAEAEAEAEAEVSPLLDDPNLSEGFLGSSSIEEQGITLSAKLPVAVAQAPASEPLSLGSVDRQQQLPALTLSSRQALPPAVRLELGSPSPTPPSPRPALTILLPAVSMELGPQ
jgi:DNA polymerase-3 subunit gamma/tau